MPRSASRQIQTAPLQKAQGEEARCVVPNLNSNPSLSPSLSRSGWAARAAVGAAPTRLRPVERRVQAGVCPVCTCDAVQFDEVTLGRALKLAECPRCEHRWTTPVATTRLARARRRMASVPVASVDAAAQA